MLPSPYYLDEQHGHYLYRDCSFTDPIQRARQHLYLRGITDLAEIIGDFVREMVIWSNGRSLIRKENNWVTAVIADEILRANGWRWSRAEAVIAAFQSLLDVKYIAEERLNPLVVAAFSAAIIPGGSDRPLGQRLPTLRKELKDWPSQPN